MFPRFAFSQRMGTYIYDPDCNENISLYTYKENGMRKIIVTTWITLDGFLAGPNGEMDWVMVDQAMGQYEDDLVSSADTLILGRATYQSFAGSWPHVPENPSASEGEKIYARKRNSMRKIVISKSLERA